MECIHNNWPTRSLVDNADNLLWNEPYAAILDITQLPAPLARPFARTERES